MGKFFDQMPPGDQRDFAWAAGNAARKDTLAAFMDRLIMREDRIEEIVRKTVAGAQSRKHVMKHTEGTIRAHVRFRIGQARKRK